MTEIILLDASPLGLVTNPRETDETREAALWIRQLSVHGVRVVVPEIADYEVRRELIRADKHAGLSRLDALRASAEFLPITSTAMLVAAEFWAVARRRGRQSARDDSLDADVILAAQARTLTVDATDGVIVATTNVRHLALFVDARLWRDIGG